MRRFFRWLLRVGIAVVVLAVVAEVLLLGVNAVEEHHLKGILNLPRSEFVIEEPARLALDHVRIIDGTGAPTRQDQSIIIESGRITYVGPSSSRPHLAGETALDLTGRTVLPGMVGMHEHLFTMAPTLSMGGVEQSVLFSRMYLASGVTTIRTTGSMAPEQDLAIKQEIDREEIAGPEIHPTAPYLEGSPPTFSLMHGLANADEARQSVAHWADRGMTSFKAYMMITPEELRAAAAEAHGRGLKITGHLCAVGFKEAADLGIDNLEHGLLVDTEFYTKKQADVCPDFPAYLREYNDRLDIESQPVQEMIRYLVAKHVALTSTLAVFESSLGGTLPAEEIQRSRRAMTWKAWKLSRLRVAGGRHAHLDRLVDKEMAFERDFVKAGGTLLAGCDPTGDGSVLAGFGDQRGIELLVKAGFLPTEAIQIATKNGADFLGIGDRVGTVASGKEADLVVVKGNPAEKIADIKNVEIVFRNGIAYNPAKLLEGIDGVVGLEN
jgi:imidazolonepropionase-like amidohydrolase